MSISSCIWSAASTACAAVGNHGHQAVAQRLDDDAAGGGHAAGDGVHRLGDDLGRVGVAEQFVQRGAATKIGEDDGTTLDG
jgi:hypothetical protein